MNIVHEELLTKTTRIHDKLVWCEWDCSCYIDQKDCGICFNVCMKDKSSYRGNMCGMEIYHLRNGWQFKYHETEWRIYQAA
jgi:hypothetical protein